MSRKSSSKKSPAILWYHCEKCLVNISSSDRNNHEKFCPITSESSKLSYIKDNKLFTTNLDKKFSSDETNDISTKHLNYLIFISEAAINLCKFFIGQQVAISSSAKEYTLVRYVWPIPDRFLSSVFVSEEDFSSNWDIFKDSQIKIEKLPSDPIPIDTIILTPTEDSALENDEIDVVSKILIVEIRNLVFCLKNQIHLNFYNRKLCFTITDFRSKCSTNSNRDESLDMQLQNLNLKSELFLLVTQKTQIQIVQQFLQPIAVDNLKTELKICKNDIGGLSDTLQILEETMNLALGIQQNSNEISAGLKISRGVLLFGPSGCGKSMICEALSNEISQQVKLIKINANEIFSKFFGETERNLQTYFDVGFKAYPQSSLIIVEDINNICPKYEANEIVKRVSAAFLNLLDSMHLKREGSRMFLIATTGNVDNLNSAVRRCGRLDNEIEISAPNPLARLDILEKHLKKIDNHSISENDIKNIADITHGFVGSDLVNLIYKAAMNSLNRKASSSSSNSITSDDVNYALTQVKPSAMREVHIENPNVKWEDIGGQDELKLKLKQAIEWPLLYPEKFKRLGIKPPRGILMFGPPGCSKTMIAKALATESKLNFLSIKGPELFSMWVGESERAVREVFRKARQVAPAIIFFDEIDAIGGERATDGGGSGSSVKERVLTQILTELDGVDVLNNVTIVAATNRPDMCDKALLRPGRIDRIVYVGLPDQKTRGEIFAIKLKKMPISNNVRIEELVNRTDGYSGAEIHAVCHEAALKALEESFDAIDVKFDHFEYALKIVQPRTSKELLKIYDDYLKQQ